MNPTRSRPDATTESLFLSYRDRGDAAALSAVFERTAPEVLRIALYLTRDRGAAEDLLQDTFLTAIENAPRFDDRRPLVPWLLGILANHARRLRSTGGRAPDAARLPDPPAPRPDVDAAARELHADLAAALTTLPPTYRQALDLHLVRGLAGSEIARALAVPQGTVRSWIHRGLEHLRRALPVGHALPAFSAVDVALGLDRVRARLIARGALLAPDAAPSGVSPAGSMAARGATGWLPMAAALLIVGVAALGLFGLPPRGPRAPLLSPVSIGSPVAAVAPTATADPALRRAVATLAGGDAGNGARDLDPAPHARAAEGEGTLIVRVTHGADAPAAGVGIALTAFTLRDGCRVWLRGVSGADGTCRFERVPAGKVVTQTDRGAGGLHEVRGGAATAAAIRLPATFDVEGEVVDRAGQGVANAEVSLIPACGSDFLGVRADAAGRFRLPWMTGRVWVGARAAGCAPSAVHQGRAAADTVKRLRLVLPGPGARLRGRVIDAGGAPPRGAWLLVGREVCANDAAVAADETCAGWTALPELPYRIECDAEGRFAADWLVPGRTTLVAFVGGVARHWQVVATRADATTDVDLRLPAGAGLAGVVTMGDGHPATETGLVLEPEPFPLRNDGFRGLLGITCHVDAQGRFALAGLAPGTFRAQAMTMKGEQTTAAVALRAAQATRWDPVLGTGSGQVSGRVVDGQGRPRERWHVQAVIAGFDPGGSFEAWRTVRRVCTDADGRFVLSELSDRAYAVAVFEAVAEGEAAPCFPVAVSADVRAGTGALTIAILDEQRASARIRGGVQDPDGRALAGATVRIARTGPPPLPFPWTTHVGTVAGADGRFDLGPLPPGTYRLTITSPGMTALAVESRVLVAGQRDDLGSVRMARR